MKDDMWLGILLGAVFIGIPVILFLIARPSGASFGMPAGNYANEETWTVVEDSKGNVAQIIVKREAKRS